MAATLTIPEASAELGISAATGYRLAKRGEFPVPVLHIGRSMRVARVQIDRLLSGEQVAS